MIYDFVLPMQPTSGEICLKISSKHRELSPNFNAGYELTLPVDSAITTRRSN